MFAAVSTEHYSVQFKKVSPPLWIMKMAKDFDIPLKDKVLESALLTIHSKSTCIQTGLFQFTLTQRLLQNQIWAAPAVITLGAVQVWFHSAVPIFETFCNIYEKQLQDKPSLEYLLASMNSDAQTDTGTEVGADSLEICQGIITI